MKKREINTVLLYAFTFPALVILIGIIKNFDVTSSSLVFLVTFEFIIGGLLGYIMIKIEQNRMLESLFNIKDRIVTAREIYAIFLFGLIFWLLGRELFGSNMVVDVGSSLVGWFIGYWIVKQHRKRKKK